MINQDSGQEHQVTVVAAGVMARAVGGLRGGVMASAAAPASSGDTAHNAEVV